MRKNFIKTYFLVLARPIKLNILESNSTLHPERSLSSAIMFAWERTANVDVNKAKIVIFLEVAVLN